MLDYLAHHYCKCAADEQFANERMEIATPAAMETEDDCETDSEHKVIEEQEEPEEEEDS